MPNYCNNFIELSHPDPAQVQRACDAMTRGEFLSEFIPVPEALQIVAGRVGSDEDPEQIKLHEQTQNNLSVYGYATWYDWCVGEWGTKWDVGCEGYAVQPEADGRMCIGFDSAWAPPILAMEKMVDMGFSIRLYYYEPGMAFCGIWEDFNDDYYDIGGMTADDVEAELPTELDEMFEISQCMREYEEDNPEEELTEWYKDSVEQTGVVPHTTKE
jgi:hypothetical protein